MKRISCVIFIIVTLVLSSCAQPTAEPQVEKEAAETEIQVDTPKKEWSEEQSEEIARQLLQNSPTFTSRGIDDTLRLISITPLKQPHSWQFYYVFESKFPGYGIVGGQSTHQVWQPHE